MSDEMMIEKKNCRLCSEDFVITDKDLEFLDKISPVFAGERFNITLPTLCPRCREQRRLSFRNERNIYRRKCDLTGKDILSNYSPDKPYRVFEYKDWWSDKWDAMDYGDSFDFKKTFFEQFSELSLKVPKYSLYNIDTENSDYSNYTIHSRNNYLVFGAMESENGYFSSNMIRSKDSLDCNYLFDSELCYECSNVENSHNCFFGQESVKCNECYFMCDCRNCDYCIGCWNLDGKKYHILNKPVSMEEFNIMKNKIFSSYSDLMDFKEKYGNILKNQAIHRSNHGFNNENIEGDYIYNSKNIQNSFIVYDSENVRNSTRFANQTNSSDIYGCFEGYNLYDSISCDFGSNMRFSKDSEKCKQSFYLDICDNSSNLFGCIGLRNSQYCILNKQYTKEQYEQLVPKIIEHMRTTGEWGEFFPSSISPFGYNETVAMEYYPISSRDAINRIATDGKPIFSWSTYENPIPIVSKTIPAEKLPNNISEVPDDILNWAILCEITQKPFRIIKQELEFYRKYSLPIPRRHPDVRHMDRMKLRNPRKLFERSCDKCNKEIKTTYSLERPEIVYCEDCYNKEII
ncbi:MAG: hypothetical protein PHS92_04930 [Candidatus Gracilibacteria bacterium]|nr:hypothetical protein [Candidatus Gracilibacteria bacterium]